MEVHSRISLFLISVLSLLFFKLSNSATIIVDGVSEWKDPVVHPGDSIIFKPKESYRLYIFRNREAFNLCNFTQAALLTRNNSTSFTWHPSRPGFFYFSFNNGTANSCQCQKLAIMVSLSRPAASAPSLAPSPTVIPAPSAGGSVSSSPAYPWPFQPHESISPSPAPSSTVLPANSPSLLPEKGGGIPFISSNPAVALPTGEVDSATIRPVSTSGHGGLVAAVHMSLICFVISMVLLLP